MAYANVASAIDNAARLYGVSAGLLRAIAHVETGGTYKTNLVSKRGAEGLFQLMPGTSEGVDAFNPNYAAVRAAKFLHAMYLRFGAWPQAIAAYNWGPGMVGGNDDRPPSLDPAVWPSSVRTYVSSVLKLWQQYAPWEHQPVTPQLAAPAVAIASAPATPSSGAAAGAFVVLGILGLAALASRR